MFACFLSLNKDINSIIKIYITIKSQFETNFKKTIKNFRYTDHALSKFLTDLTNKKSHKA